ncbi:sulfite exporter TauE/SafE family protein [Shewanella atlantica]|uniref:Sulfite exporter TauE/SafE family protein n=1 Tax=Shewanella atlantica TaxID=271099 RepID=A0A431WD85_9GAMM|nr:sulfite exporter TauE/SafE family protein [Shewanella atlantica]RTR33502.1 sulfite exporter TauE/SafE family protein [Shewanella atlantica]
MIEYSITGAFLVGLMGAGHCIGMCGGLIGAFSSQLPRSTKQNQLALQLRFLFTYNLGRILSYALAGALVGGSASALGMLFDMDLYLITLRLIAGVMMVATGLYIAQIWSGVVQVERAGKFIWRFLSPIASKMVPVKTIPQAFIGGMLWGWLPCGLVYSTLTWAVAANSAAQGAMIMASFGLGTLPALLSAGVAANVFGRWVQNRMVRLVSGSILVIFGLQTLYIAIAQLN